MPSETNSRGGAPQSTTPEPEPLGTLGPVLEPTQELPSKQGRPRWVWLLIIVQIVIPMVLLIARWQDPSIGVQPFGWQVHTNCWGSDEC